jgi:hypothetical protein
MHAAVIFVAFCCHQSACRRPRPSSLIQHTRSCSSATPALHASGSQQASSAPSAPVITSIASLAVCHHVWRMLPPPSTSSKRRTAQTQQQQPPVRAHIIHGLPAHTSEVMTLQLPTLSPLTMTKSAIGEFLQSQLRSRPAAQQKVQAAVLSAVYMPSQLVGTRGVSFLQTLIHHITGGTQSTLARAISTASLT